MPTTLESVGVVGILYALYLYALNYNFIFWAERMKL